MSVNNIVQPSFEFVPIGTVIRFVFREADVGLELSDSNFLWKEVQAGRCPGIPIEDTETTGGGSCSSCKSRSVEVRVEYFIFTLKGEDAVIREDSFI